MSLKDGNTALLRISIISTKGELITFTAGKEDGPCSVYSISKKYEDEIILLKQDDKVKRRNE